MPVLGRGLLGRGRSVSSSNSSSTTAARRDIARGVWDVIDAADAMEDDDRAMTVVCTGAVAGGGADQRLLCSACRECHPVRQRRATPSTSRRCLQFLCDQSPLTDSLSPTARHIDNDSMQTSRLIWDIHKGGCRDLIDITPTFLEFHPQNV